MATALIPRRNRSGKLAPWREEWFPSVWQDMDRLLRTFELAPFAGLETVEGEFFPSIDVSETDKEIKVSAELPGMSEEDINVMVSRDSVTISGEKKQGSEDKSKGYYRVERSFGSFYRTIPLMAEVDTSKADATFRKGVLEIRLPKTENGQKEHKKVKIKGE